MFGGECEDTTALVFTGNSHRGATLDPEPLCILPLHSPPRSKTCAEAGEISWWEGLSEGSAEEERLSAKANRCLADADVGVHLQHILKHKHHGVAYAKHLHPLFLFF